MASPWTIGREEEIVEKIEQIRKRLDTRKERREMLNARRRLRVNRGKGVEQFEEELDMMNDEIKGARKQLERVW